MNDQRKFRFRLTITREEYLSYYAGAASWVMAKAFEGETVRFPASFLREFVSEDGVHGTFEMVVDENDKLISLRRLKPSG
jgi:adenine deaminase